MPTIISIDRKVRARHIEIIAEAQAELEAAIRLLEVRVIDARKAGVSWTAIAEGLGMARQSATERFIKLPEIAVLEG